MNNVLTAGDDEMASFSLCIFADQGKRPRRGAFDPTKKIRIHTYRSTASGRAQRSDHHREPHDGRQHSAPQHEHEGRVPVRPVVR